MQTFKALPMLRLTMLMVVAMLAVELELPMMEVK